MKGREDWLVCGVIFKRAKAFSWYFAVYLFYFGNQKKILRILVVFQACFAESPPGCVWGP